MKTKWIRLTTAILWSYSVIASGLVQAEDMTTRTSDVALQSGGVLVGQVTSPEGKPLSEVLVQVVANGSEIARGQSDNQGNFRIPGLKGGSVQIVSTNFSQQYRLWAPETAPPVAQPGVLVVSGSDVVRGQCGTGVCCGSGVGVGGGGGGGRGGLLGVMLDRPLVTAGVIGAAIAIPLAVADDDAPASN